MRIDEVMKIHDVLDADQYVTLLRQLKSNVKDDINLTRIKNKVIQSWKKGMKSRKHYDSLLQPIHLSLKDLID